MISEYSLPMAFAVQLRFCEMPRRQSSIRLLYPCGKCNSKGPKTVNLKILVPRAIPVVFLTNVLMSYAYVYTHT